MMPWNDREFEPEPMKVRFIPKHDITPYELALIIAKTMRQPIVIPWDVWPTIDQSIRRHFK